ncbi:class I SAM-dependent methyltransferase [Azospirillum sp. TSO22-1]|uniref:class I SAM-dependent methyltransferase n=1 Tax=Azospirillum sp. TSO22-1 TaxID=716789 RepID=UPI0011B6DFE2|nr:class I SAM-dependent methyltransferase [Azospirillum sp. TSO22-1]
MAHPEQVFFVRSIKNFLESHFVDAEVLEIGSLDINGSVREHFERCRYIGIDLELGPGVDVACPGEDFGGKAHQFNTIVSCEAMEHNRNWRETWLNMIRMLRKDGLMIMTCASLGRRRHGTAEDVPSDSPFTSHDGMNYYRNLDISDFTKLVNHDDWFSVWGFFRDHVIRDVYFFGIGKEADEMTQRNAVNLKVVFEQFYNARNTEGRY